MKNVNSQLGMRKSTLSKPTYIIYSRDYQHWTNYRGENFKHWKTLESILPSLLNQLFAYFLTGIRALEHNINVLLGCQYDYNLSNCQKR